MTLPLGTICESGIHIIDRLECEMHHVAVVHPVMQLIPSKGIWIINLYQHVASPSGSERLEVAHPLLNPSPITTLCEGLKGNGPRLIKF